MFRDIFTNKWIIGGVLLLIIITCGCYFWYQHSLTANRKAAADAQQLLRQSEIERQAKVKSSTAKHAAEKAPADSITPTAEKPKADATATTDTSIGGTQKAVTAAMQETDKTEEVRVSPHGFGPYPEIPEDSPFDEFHFEESDTRTMELLGRVEIKAWINGERFEGSSYDLGRGKVYLHYSNTLYVEYGDPVEDADGNVRIPITDVLGAGDVHLTSEQMKNGEIPGGVRVLSLRDDGIDPYEYLELQ
ncbi:MAG: hypothetical protein OXU23_17455 [Candidatus Poribacteria bacterium]|nr:hypothetical protein [Candidatus Poribacteria bacterium]